MVKQVWYLKINRAPADFLVKTKMKKEKNINTLIMNYYYNYYYLSKLKYKLSLIEYNDKLSNFVSLIFSSN